MLNSQRPSDVEDYDWYHGLSEEEEKALFDNCPELVEIAEADLYQITPEVNDNATKFGLGRPHQNGPHHSMDLQWFEDHGLSIVYEYFGQPLQNSRNILQAFLHQLRFENLIIDKTPYHISLGDIIEIYRTNDEEKSTWFETLYWIKDYLYHDEKTAKTLRDFTLLGQGSIRRV